MVNDGKEKFDLYKIDTKVKIDKKRVIIVILIILSFICIILTGNYISKITKETKYINIPIDIVDNNINNYFLINGVDYSYSENINSKQGFIYTDYNMFKQGELLIDSIIKDIPQNLSDIEKVRYIYITLGKELNIDINTLSSKNEILSLNNITNLNNIWGALSKKSITRSSIVKILLYICSKIGIKSEVVSTDIKGNMANKIYINNTYIIVNLFEDIANIKAGFSTEHFDKYNNNIELDKKILVSFNSSSSSLKIV